MMNKQYFEHRGNNCNDFDFWRYGRELGMKLDNIEVERITSHIPSECPKIVDLGCGTGYHIKMLAELDENFNCVGIDFSRSYIENAKKNTAHLNNVRFFHSSTEDFVHEINGMKVDEFLLIGLIQYLSFKETVELADKMYENASDECVVIVKHPLNLGSAETNIETTREGIAYSSMYKGFDEIALAFSEKFNFRCMYNLFDRREFTAHEYEAINSKEKSCQVMIVFEKK